MWWEAGGGGCGGKQGKVGVVGVRERWVWWEAEGVKKKVGVVRGM